MVMQWKRPPTEAQPIHGNAVETTDDRSLADDRAGHLAASIMRKPAPGPAAASVLESVPYTGRRILFQEAL
jgi:hypothetical protein